MHTEMFLLYLFANEIAMFFLLGLGETFSNGLPVDDFPDSFEVIGTYVLVLQVVSLHIIDQHSVINCKPMMAFLTEHSHVPKHQHRAMGPSLIIRKENKVEYLWWHKRH